MFDNLMPKQLIYESVNGVELSNFSSAYFNDSFFEVRYEIYSHQFFVKSTINGMM